MIYNVIYYRCVVAVLINIVLLFILDASHKGDIVLKEVEWSIQKEVEQNIYYPIQVALCDDEIILSDYEGIHPFRRYSTDLEYLDTIGEWGRGPGEVVKPAYIAGCEKDIVYAYSDLNRTMTMYRKSGEYLGNIDSPRLYQSLDARVVDNTLIIVTTQLNPYAIGFPFIQKRDAEVKNDTVMYGDKNEISPLETVSEYRNILLKDGIMSSDGRNFYAALRYGSLLMGFTVEGENLFHTLQPHNVDIPEYGAGEHYGVQPPFSEYPHAYITIDVDERYVYTIFSGAELSSRNVITGRMEHKILQGKLLNIHDKTTGEYKFTIEMPFLIGGIAVSDDAIYAISRYPEIRLVKFEKPDILR